MRNLISKRLLTQLTAGNLKALPTSIGGKNTIRPLSTSHHLNTDFEWHSSGRYLIQLVRFTYFTNFRYYDLTYSRQSKLKKLFQLMVFFTKKQDFHLNSRDFFMEVHKQNLGFSTYNLKDFFHSRTMNRNP